MIDDDAHLLLQYLDQSGQLRPVVDGLLKSACGPGSSSRAQTLTQLEQALVHSAWQDQDGFDATPKKGAPPRAAAPGGPADAQGLDIVDIETAHDVDASLLLEFDAELGHRCVLVPVLSMHAMRLCMYC